VRGCDQPAHNSSFLRKKFDGMVQAMISSTTLRTGAWYGDKEIELRTPSGWDIKVLWPATPPPLTNEDLAIRLERPVGQISFKKMCEGKSRPIIIVDDLNRPTPTARVMPLLLKCLSDAGIPKQNITILMATGSHGEPRPDAMLKKVGPEAASSCRLLIHDCFRNVKQIGKTTFGTPVLVNQAVMECDMVIGVGGIYPNHTAGFGGGSKLALGILGIRTIYHLHFRHKVAGWGVSNSNNTLRRELDEIAGMIGMNTTLCLVIDADRNIIQMYCGDQRKYFQEAITFYRETFRTSLPADAEVIISNTYPNDLSLTFARMKGFVPLNSCKSGTSRIAIASCSEGLGLHNIFPFVNVPRFHWPQHITRRLSVMSPGEILCKTGGVLKRKVRARFKNSPLRRMTLKNAVERPVNPIWLYRPGDQAEKLLSHVPGIHIVSEWSEIVEAIRKEQANRNSLKVLIYPCAFLQLPEEGLL